MTKKDLTKRDLQNAYRRLMAWLKKVNPRSHEAVQLTSFLWLYRHGARTPKMYEAMIDLEGRLKKLAS